MPIAAAQIRFALPDAHLKVCKFARTFPQWPRPPSANRHLKASFADSQNKTGCLFQGKNWRRDFDAVKARAGYGGRSGEEAGLKRWTADVMRHTGISYHLAQHQHEGKTAAWAGNSPDVVQRHYKGLVKPKDAKEFWKIIPTKAQDNILKMCAA